MPRDLNLPGSHGQCPVLGCIGTELVEGQRESKRRLRPKMDIEPAVMDPAMIVVRLGGALDDPPMLALDQFSCSRVSFARARAANLSLKIVPAASSEGALRRVPAARVRDRSGPP
jgi:hypothetical protein